MTTITGYRVLITLQGWNEHHEAYFINKPTKEDVLRSIGHDKEVADSAYKDFYGKMSALVQTNSMIIPNNLGERGFNLFAPENNRDHFPAAGYMRILKFRFQDVQQES